MTEQASKKQGLKKCRSATFCIDGFSFTIVANEAGERNRRTRSRFTRSQSQNALWNAITVGVAIKDGDKQRGILTDQRSPEDILTDPLPGLDTPDAMEKTANSAQSQTRQVIHRSSGDRRGCGRSPHSLEKEPEENSYSGSV